MASKRRQRRKSCEGKARHKDRTGALIALHKMFKEKGHQGQMHPYKCPHCGMWHIGHIPGANGIGSAYGGHGYHHRHRAR